MMIGMIIVLRIINALLLMSAYTSSIIGLDISYVVLIILFKGVYLIAINGMVTLCPKLFLLRNIAPTLIPS